MLKKLLKYNLKNQFKFFGILYGIVIPSAVISRLLAGWTDAPGIIVIVQQFFEGAMWAMIANILINNILRIWVEFRRNLYGDESYLMHTLPVKTSTLYWSKVLGALIMLLVNAVVIVASIAIRYADSGLFDFVKEVLEAKTAGVSPTIYMMLLGFILLMQMFNIIMVGFLAIILGHKKNNNKVAWSLGYGFLVYLATQLISVAVFAISGIFDSEMFGLFTGNGSSFDPQAVKTLLIESCITYPVIIILGGVIAAKSLNRGFDID